MEGFLNLKWSRWRLVLFTRSVAIAPTFAVTLTSHMRQLSSMNDYLNALMSLMQGVNNSLTKESQRILFLSKNFSLSKEFSFCQRILNFFK